MLDIVMNLLVGVTIAVVSAWVTVQLSIRRFRTEKWWEKKAEAYERVIDALHHAKVFSDAHICADMRGRELSEGREKVLRAKSREAQLEVERVADVGSFLLGDEAQKRLRQYLKERRGAADTTSWFDYLLADLAATNACLDDLIRIAKKDLGTR